jgi:hypothetical protein
MSQPTPDVVVQRMHRDLRHYIARQKPGHVARLLLDQDVREMAAVAYRAVPQPRDVEVVQERGTRLAVAEVRRMDPLVLEQLATERSTAEIARLLVLTPGQVESRQRALYRRLGVGGRVTAVLEAIDRGWLARDGGAWRAVEALLAGLGSEVRSDCGPGGDSLAPLAAAKVGHESLPDGDSSGPQIATDGFGGAQ